MSGDVDASRVKLGLLTAAGIAIPLAGLVAGYGELRAQAQRIDQIEPRVQVVERIASAHVVTLSAMESRADRTDREQEKRAAEANTRLSRIEDKLDDIAKELRQRR